MLAAKLLFIDSYYFLLVKLLNDLYQQSLFVCSCSKRAQGSAIKHQQGINFIVLCYSTMSKLPPSIVRDTGNNLYVCF